MDGKGVIGKLDGWGKVPSVLLLTLDMRSLEIDWVDSNMFESSDLKASRVTTPIMVEASCEGLCMSELPSNAVGTSFDPIGAPGTLELS